MYSTVQEGVEAINHGYEVEKLPQSIMGYLWRQKNETKIKKCIAE